MNDNETRIRTKIISNSKFLSLDDLIQHYQKDLALKYKTLLQITDAKEVGKINAIIEYIEFQLNEYTEIKNK